MDLTVLHNGTRDNPIYFYMDLHYKLTVARRLALENAAARAEDYDFGRAEARKNWISANYL